MRRTYLFIAVLLIGGISLFGQNAPIDFEASGYGADWNWTVFENGSNPPLEIISNPDVSGINTSASVAKFTALAVGAPFAGCESMHGTDIGSFVIDSDNMIIRIMVWKSVISNVGVKLVREDNWSLGEILIPNTVTEEWEQLTYDFSSHVGLPYDQIVIFPDFAERDSDNIIYFDNIMGAEAIATDITESVEPSFRLSPNPANEIISLQSTEEIDQVEIYDINGKLIESLILDDEPFNLHLDIRRYEVGLYSVQVFANGRRSSQRFLKN